ncbi:uncharacterized protein HMPREF1541_01541 [Cyphellophora europaea CBS 101466]|uniref:Amidase domain-containing protein n=1 Tax=Cyphellophora europaea (strain CBS 101466) TaxID=1220924 RepID=W2S157_CYPE1|nr:uncharacterized protein HMPREF1541_01541 [Cyphellophora europaea CBS 101466]ETN42387.1 hypothetical protein HMPREF1541_01541 [Cyphellophora europaea CBS 101466]
MDSQLPTSDGSIVEATIADLTAALTSQRTTAVDLVTSYLLRIATYDTRNTALNSIPLLNPNVFTEAAASDARRAAGQPLAPLEGIPFTVKDSYKVRGMTVASGSEAFQHLIASEDAFTVKTLRDAGAILIGKTNMCPMAFGGMLRGVYGRAESPYNAQYLAAAFASGSSNGSGVSTGASFAAFGMGEETVSSGRSPASNNALVAYTPSRGLISIRGNWPLYPTCDVVVPHTRCMDDMLTILDILTMEDENTIGDFWRDQPFVETRNKWLRRPSSFADIKDAHFLSGKKIAVPAMYIGQSSHETGVYTSDAVIDLWSQAKADFEACGATVEVVQDLPVMRLYQDPSSSNAEELPEYLRLPEDWNSSERGTLIAHAWDDFLQINGDPSLSKLAAADWTKFFPQMSPDDPQLRFSEVANAVHWSKLASYVENNVKCVASGSSKIYDVPHLSRAVTALENMRKRLFEDWMSIEKFDFVVFPAAGDVGYAEADIDVDLARHTWRDGVKYSNGNRCLRHLGIPSITVPMGMLRDKGMPMGLTILGKAYDDVDILKAGYAFEQRRQGRVAPPRTPTLPTDVLCGERLDLAAPPPMLEMTDCHATAVSKLELVIAIEGRVGIPEQISRTGVRPAVEVYIDGIKNPESGLKLSPINGSNMFNFRGEWAVPAPPEQDERNKVVGRIARDGTMIIVRARNGSGGRPAGVLRLLDSRDTGS